MARNSLYSNCSDSSRKGDGWIYSDGELYHYGRKGMQWGKTIFGGYDNPLSFTYDPNRGLFDNMGRAASTTWGNVTGYGKHVYNNANKKYGNSVRKAWKSATSPKSNYNYNNIEWSKYKKDNGLDSTSKMTHLERNMGDQIEDGYNAYNEMLKKPTFFNKLNFAFQNAQYDVVSGVNNVLRKLGLDDEVDAFLSVFLGNSSARKRAAEANHEGAQSKDNDSQFVKNQKIITRDRNDRALKNDSQSRDNNASTRAANAAYSWTQSVRNDAQADDKKTIRELEKAALEAQRAYEQAMSGYQVDDKDWMRRL